MEASDLERIKFLVPFHGMDEQQLKAALSKTTIVNYPGGRMIFKRNENDPLVHWLLSGSVDLLDEKFEAKTRTAVDDASKFPLDNNNPHLLSAVTTEKTRVLQIERDEIGVFGASERVAEIDEGDDERIDWMSALLSSPLFEFIPPTNIQMLFSKFEKVEYEPGDVVIRQGDRGDFFYVIQSGRVRVERTAGEKSGVLAELKAGDNFGQDALVSDIPRNATVSMITRGSLMRLSGPDFESLLMRPLIETVSLDEVKEMVGQGNPRTYILDVRNPNELDSNKIEGSINVPLLSLRKNLPKLRADAIYVTFCGKGRRAELGAYILNENGFTAYVLKDETQAESA